MITCVLGAASATDASSAAARSARELREGSPESSRLEASEFGFRVADSNQGSEWKYSDFMAQTCGRRNEGSSIISATRMFECAHMSTNQRKQTENTD